MDTQQQFDRVVAALRKAGFDKITALKGDDGIQLLERLDGFFFSDADEPVLHRHIDELKAGHISIAVETSSPQAEEAAQVASDHGARFLVHFGYLTVSWLKK